MDCECATRHGALCSDFILLSVASGQDETTLSTSIFMAITTFAHGVPVLTYLGCGFGAHDLASAVALALPFARRYEGNLKTFAASQYHPIVSAANKLQLLQKTTWGVKCRALFE